MRRTHRRDRSMALLLGLGLAFAIPCPPASAQQNQQQQSADDRPYDNKLVRLSEILGAVHYLRELCGHGEGQTWRDQMRELLRTEGTTPIRRARLVSGFNHGYSGYSRTYRSCTDSARTAIARFMEEGALIANTLAAEKPKAPATDNSSTGSTGGSSSNAPTQPRSNAGLENTPGATSSR